MFSSRWGRVVALCAVSAAQLLACDDPGGSGVDAHFGSTTQGLSGQNDAPVLDTAKSPTLIPMYATSALPTGAVGTPVSSLVDFDTPAGQLDNVSDADNTDGDPPASLGIAITAADTTNGAWYYSTNGGLAWTALGAVGTGTAQLLAADANTRLYFQPAIVSFSGTATITFRAWDRTTGTNGTMADTSVNGGTSAFSTATDAASITVVPTIQFRSSSSAGTNGTSSTTLAIAKPTGVVAGDFLVAGITAFANGAAPTITAPAGWTLVATQTSGTEAFAVYSRKVDNTDGASYSWTFGASSAAAGGIEAFTGVNLNNPIQVTASTATASSLTHTATSVNTFLGNTMLLTWHAYASAGTWTPPGGMTEGVQKMSEPSTGAGGVSIEGNFKSLAAAGATGPQAAVASNNADTGAVATIVLQTVNNAPVLDATKTPTLTAENEDAPAPTGAVGTLVSSLVDSTSPAGGVDNVTDIDGTTLLGIAITATDSASGTWWYSTDGGTLWIQVPAVSTASALLLAANASTRLYFQPNANFNGTSSVTFRAWDMSLGTAGIVSDTTSNGGTTAYSLFTDTASLVINSINDAPTLDSTKTPVLASVSEDAPAPTGAVGSLVSTLVDFTTPAGGLDNVTDPDSGAVTGIAVTGSDGALTGYYSLDGGTTWAPIGAVSDASALLLAADSDNRVYFIAGANVSGTFANALTFRAWDQTSGADGAMVSAAANGGATAFSAANDGASLTVTPVNDAPTATGLSAPETYTEDTPLDLTNIVVTDIDSANITATLTLSNLAAGSLSTGTSGAVTSTFNAGTGVWSASGAIADVNALLAGLTYTPALDFNASFTIATSVDDGVAPALTGSKPMTGTPVNDAPTATGMNAAETYTEDTPLDLIDIVVSDVDSTMVTVTLTLSNPAAGALSTGTSGTVTSTYNAGTGVWTASGVLADVNAELAAVTFTPAANFNANITIATSVTDNVATAITGGKAMTGTPVNDAPTATNMSAAESYTEDTPLDLTNIVISDIDSATITATLTLSTPAAGSLSTGNSGSVTSTYSAGTGVWTASGAIADVNNLLAGVTYNPALNFNSSFTIATSVTDNASAPVTGSKAMTGTAVNDAPTATNLSAAETYTEDTPLNLIDVVVSDVDGGTVTVTFTLSTLAAGTLSTATAGSTTSTFNTSTGVWTASGPISEVNTLLAGLTFTPAANFNTFFSIATSVSDGIAPAITGTKGFNGVPVNDPPVASNLSAPETYTENFPLNLTDIVASDTDSLSITATLTLSNPAAGTLNTGTSGTVTSTYNASTGVWTASGLLSSVNTLLAGLTFTPATNFNATFTIATSVSDGVSAVSGTKTMTGIAVNNPPTATNLSAPETYTEDTPLDLTNIVVSDVDSPNVQVSLTLSNTGAGSLSTGSSNSVTSTYDGSTGVWSASGALADVNALLASVTFTPTANFNSSFTIATSVSDGVATAITGTKAVTGTPVNDAPTATNLSAPEAYTEDTAVDLTDIVVSDIDGGNLTVTLTLSTTAAGTLSTATSGAVTSTFSGGVWTASGAIANVNTLLAGVMFVPATNFNANFAINTSVSDGVAAAVTGSKAMTGTAVNDAPTAVDDAATVAEGASMAIPVAANDTDPDDALNPASIAIGTMPTHGTVTVGTDGSVTYTHDSSDTTSDSFTYTIKDASDAVSNVATVAITITPVADDGDGDGVADDVDNCPTMANASQADADGDGIGDKCDPTPGGTDTGCGCSSSHGSPAGAWPLALALVALGRRRRRAKRA